MGTSESLHETFAQIRAARAGDREAMNDLLTRFLPYVRNAVQRHHSRLLQDRDALPDILQESLLDAFRGIHRFADRDGTGFRAWLLQLVVNNIRDHERRRARRHREARSGEGQDHVSWLAGHEPRPSQIAHAAELEQRIARAMQRLPVLHRRILELRAQSRLSDAEIAATLGYRNGDTVARLHRRAMHNLQELLRDAAGPDGDDAS